MPVYLVTYDLNKEVKGSWRPWTDLVQFLESIGDIQRLSESSYAVDTDLRESEIVSSAKTRGLFDSNDAFWVFKMTETVYGEGPQETIDWLTERGL